MRWVPDPGGQVRGTVRMHSHDVVSNYGPSGPRECLRTFLPIISPVVAIAVLFIIMALARPAMAEDMVWSDKVVVVDESYDDLDLTLDGNLTISPHANLTITNSTITVNTSSPRGLHISVEQNGLLNLSDVDILASGGTYTFTVEGTLVFTQGSIKDLPEASSEDDRSSGLRVLSGGRVILTDVDIDNLFGLALSVDADGFASIEGGLLRGSSRVIWIEDGVVVMEGSEVVATRGRALVDIIGSDGGSGQLWATDSSFISSAVMDADLPSVAVRLDGVLSSALLDHCHVGTPELAEVYNGTFHMTNGTFSKTLARDHPDLICHRALAELTGVDMVEVEVEDGALTLVGCTYASGSVTGDSSVVSVGPVPPLETLADSVTLQHHYWVDLQLLNETGAATEGLDLWIERSDGVAIIETQSGPDGWVRQVPVRSWTRKGDVKTYEPSHTVNFGESDFQITRMQVYDNTTVTLWNTVHSRDLNLDTDSMQLSVAAPRANVTFGITIDGASLVPHMYPSGEAFIDLLIDGQLNSRLTMVVGSQDDMIFDGLQLSQGRHLLQVRVDVPDAIEEMNEGGNNLVSLLIDVSAGPNGGGELVDLQVEIRTLRDAQGNEGDLIMDGVIEVHYTVRAMNAQTRLRNVDVELLVNDQVRDAVTIDIADMEDQLYLFNGVISINLPRGDYTIRLRVDPDNDISEEFELNNEASVDVTLDPEVGEDGFWDPTCCSAVLVVSLVLIVGALGAYAQKRQRDAQADGVTDMVQYPRGPTPLSSYQQPRQPSMPSSVPYHQRPTQSYGSRATRIEDRWSTERVDPAIARSYQVDGSDLTGAERIIVSRPRGPPESQQRFEVEGLTCPRCDHGDIIGFPDGSAKCKSCRKIFYPRHG